MSDYKATPEQWATLEKWGNEATYSTPACVVELRNRVKELEDSSCEHSNSNLFCFNALVARIENLEKSNQALHATTLKLANAIVGSPEKRRSLLTDLIADEDDSKPTPNSDQIGSSVKAQGELSLVVAAAVLRAAADQVAPQSYQAGIEIHSDDDGGWVNGAETRNEEIHCKLLAIAAELENING